jgi:hypothetical protein
MQSRTILAITVISCLGMFSLSQTDEKFCHSVQVSVDGRSIDDSPTVKSADNTPIEAPNEVSKWTNVKQNGNEDRMQEQNSINVYSDDSESR